MKPADLLSDPEYVALLGTVSDAKVATKYGISATAVYKHRTKLGIAPSRHSKPISPETWAKIDRMLREGTWSYAQIAKGCHVHSSTVMERAHGLGIERVEVQRSFATMKFCGTRW